METPEKKKRNPLIEPICVIDDDQEEETGGLTEETPECGVCFEVVKIRGVIDCCAHTFCYECISQWSKLQNTCPVCQRRFEYVTQLDASNPKPAGRKRKRATAFVPYKNQRTEDDWNPQEKSSFTSQGPQPLTSPEEPSGDLPANPVRGLLR
eukprot:CAMPEP_0201539132 /NCGR_PEP_ID=MMETSP0161_2-20130828/69537_1 /ASSEMBLY_ACC=CAM_ASM_000251 /TAXON_ID=180227 /ORGANISM="Neoparamoeba aestuarina, Strain SoJaBio B1-5/56/2" /LENGTH=151 /DNA_ID=CAMNT_0047946335 /DNA_START=36 /DNA_END=492 /DNA_ORIENTATION=-